MYQIVACIPIIPPAYPHHISTISRIYLSRNIPDKFYPHYPPFPATCFFFLESQLKDHHFPSPSAMVVPATATALLHALGQVLTGQSEGLREALRDQRGPCNGVARSNGMVHGWIFKIWLHNVTWCYMYHGSLRWKKWIVKIILQPTSQPASQPTNQPASQPTNQPTNKYQIRWLCSLENLHWRLVLSYRWR